MLKASESLPGLLRVSSQDVLTFTLLISIENQISHLEGFLTRAPQRLGQMDEILKSKQM